MTKCRCRLRRAVAGFTVIEALLATALMGAILYALGTVTAQWLPTWNRGFARVQRSDQLAVGLERLIADLAAAEFIPASGKSMQPLFDGEELSVVFVRSALGPNTASGLEVVQIAQRSSAAGPVLVRLRAPFAPAATGVNAARQLTFSDPVVLLRVPYQVSFAYASDDRQWRKIWRSVPQLPRAVRIMLRDSSTNDTPFAAIASLVHSELPAACNLVKSVAECFENRVLGPSREGKTPEPSARGGANQ